MLPSLFPDTILNSDHQHVNKRSLLAAYGDDGRLRGFGHLDFAKSSSVKRAVAKSGESLMGRELFVDSAANKPKRDSFGGGAERTPRQPGEHWNLPFLHH